MLRQLMLLAAVLGVLTVAGCTAPDRLAEDPKDNIHPEWRNFWSSGGGFPRGLSPYSIHGGVGPNSSSI